MIKLILVFVMFVLGAQYSFASDIHSCGIKLDYDAYSFRYYFEHGTSTAVILTKDYKQAFVGTSEDAQVYLDNNAIEGFAAIFHLKSSRNPNLFEIYIAQIMPKSGTASVVMESNFVSAGSGLLPLSLGFKANSMENINVICED